MSTGVLSPHHTRLPSRIAVPALGLQVFPPSPLTILPQDAAQFAVRLDAVPSPLGDIKHTKFEPVGLMLVSLSKGGLGFATEEQS